MKKVLISLLLLCSIALQSISQAYEGKIEYLKKDEPATVIEFPYPPDEVENAIIDRLDKLGYKRKESRGFLVYKETVITQISQQPMDYVFKIERKSRKEKDETAVYLIMNYSVENVLSRVNDPNVGNKVKEFLNQLTPYVAAYHLEMEIKIMEEEIAKSEKKLKGMKDDKEEMQKKIRKLEGDIKQNEQEQVEQVRVIDKQKHVLEDLKSKRRN